MENIEENKDHSHSEIPKFIGSRIALVIDDMVTDVMHTDNRLAAILLSEPTVIDVSDYLVGNDIKVYPGMKYDKDKNKFIDHNGNEVKSNEQ